LDGICEAAAASIRRANLPEQVDGLISSYTRRRVLISDL
jgi:hypothetical protein